MEWREDPKGYYLIKITDNQIHIALFKGIGQEKKMIKEYKGDSPKELYEQIIDDKGITYMEHAAYLGKELYKVQIAIKLNLKYVQDSELNFTGHLSK